MLASFSFWLLTLILGLVFTAATPSVTNRDRAMPRFEHIFVIMDENQDAWRITGNHTAPTLSRLATTFGYASNFFGEVHPSEGNYAALIGGSTLGIFDDDAYFCKPLQRDHLCPHAFFPFYPSHLSNEPQIGDQLSAVGLSWKGYYQSIPEAGSLAVTDHLYVSKHSGFMNYASVVNAHDRAAHLVSFEQLQRDLAQNRAPNFAFIVPNLCDDMHGMPAGPGVPTSCQHDHPAGLIARGDTMIKHLYELITSSPLWRASGNSAIVITFDEDDGSGRSGCCGVTPFWIANFGGGHIATLVITNHQHHAVHDDTPYNHYSLLRSIEDAFGIHRYLGLAAASDKGVQAMTPLFAAP